MVHDVYMTTTRKQPQIRLADPSFELRWSATGYPTSANPTFFHRCNAETEANYIQRTTGRNVDIMTFSGWEVLAKDWAAGGREGLGFNGQKEAR